MDTDRVKEQELAFKLYQLEMENPNYPRKQHFKFKSPEEDLLEKYDQDTDQFVQDNLNEIREQSRPRGFYTPKKNPSTIKEEENPLSKSMPPPMLLMPPPMLFDFNNKSKFPHLAQSMFEQNSYRRGYEDAKREFEERFRMNMMFQENGKKTLESPYFMPKETGIFKETQISRTHLKKHPKKKSI